MANIYCNAYTATEDVVGLTYQLTHNSETNIDDELHRSQTLTYDINLDLVKVVRRVDSKHENMKLSGRTTRPQNVLNTNTP